MDLETLKKTAYRKVFNGFVSDTFVDLFLDLLERAYDMVEDGDYGDIDECISQAIDDGMIYTDDQWAAYRHYCEMGDSPDVMWEGLYNDLYACFN